MKAIRALLEFASMCLLVACSVEDEPSTANPIVRALADSAALEFATSFQRDVVWILDQGTRVEPVRAGGWRTEMGDRYRDDVDGSRLNELSHIKSLQEKRREVRNLVSECMDAVRPKALYGGVKNVPYEVAAAAAEVACTRLDLLSEVAQADSVLDGKIQNEIRAVSAFLRAMTPRLDQFRASCGGPEGTECSFTGRPMTFDEYRGAKWFAQLSALILGDPELYGPAAGDAAEDGLTAGAFLRHMLANRRLTRYAQANHSAAEYLASLEAQFERNLRISERIVAAKRGRTAAQRDSVAAEICAQFGYDRGSCSLLRN